MNRKKIVSIYCVHGKKSPNIVHKENNVIKHCVNGKNVI